MEELIIFYFFVGFMFSIGLFAKEKIDLLVMLAIVVLAIFWPFAIGSLLNQIEIDVKKAWNTRVK